MGNQQAWQKECKLEVQFYFEVCQALRWERKSKCSLSISGKYSKGPCLNLQDQGLRGDLLSRREGEV